MYLVLIKIPFYFSGKTKVSFENKSGNQYLLHMTPSWKRIMHKPQNPITLVLSMFERVRIDCQEMEMRNKVSLH